jgi:DNA topoisomerase-3
VDFSGEEPLGTCPKDGGRVFELGSNYICENAVRTDAQPDPTCDFKSRKIILQQPVAREQMIKLLETGKTDLLDKFVSMRTRRPFKAFLAWDKEAGKINFEFTPSKFPRKGPARPPRRDAAAAAKVTKAGAKASTKKARIMDKDKSAAPKAPRKPGKPLTPSPALAAVIGSEPVARTQVIKKLWDYIKAHGLQDTTNKRAINADGPLLAVFGKPQVTMFELAGIVGKHLS